MEAFAKRIIGGFIVGFVVLVISLILAGILYLIYE